MFLVSRRIRETIQSEFCLVVGLRSARKLERQFNNHILEDCARTGQPGQNTTSHCGAISREVVWKLPTTWFPRAVVLMRYNPVGMSNQKGARTVAFSIPLWNWANQITAFRSALLNKPVEAWKTKYASFFCDDDCVEAGRAVGIGNGVSIFSIWIEFYWGQTCFFSCNSFTMECWSRKIDLIVQKCQNILRTI